MSSPTTPSWMDKIRGIFTSKRLPSKVEQFQSAVEAGNIKKAMKIWPTISLARQTIVFSHSVHNQKYDLLQALLPATSPETVVETIKSLMEDGDDHPITAKWLIEQKPQQSLTKKQWCELAMTAAYCKRPEVLKQLYDAHRDVLSPYLSSMDECQALMDDVAPRLPQLSPTPARYVFSLTLSVLASRGEEERMSVLLPLADAHDTLCAQTMLAVYASNSPVSPEMMNCFIQLLPITSSGKSMSLLLNQCLTHEAKEYLHVIFERHPEQKFSISNLLIGVADGNQEKFDLVFNRVDWEIGRDNGLSEVLGTCVKHDRQHMFDQLLPQAISQQTDFGAAWHWAAQNNNVAMAQKMLSPDLMSLTKPAQDDSYALQVACAYGSDDVFALLYPHSDAAKALKSLRHKFDTQYEFEALPKNTDLLDNYDTHKALTRVLQQTEEVAPAPRPRRM